MSDTPPDPLEGLLSDFSLGPAWARSKSDSKKEHFKEGSDREYKPRRGDDRNRNDRRDGRRDDRGRGRNDRRDFKKGDRGRQDFHREEIPPTPGVGVSLLPKKTAVQLICKEIHQVARVYPLYDVAKIILAERSRTLVVFEVGKKKDPFYRSKFDDAVFLTKEEAVQHLLKADWRDKFIQEETVEVDPPKGNFQSVAKCGISGEWLGPPNYHAYQTEIRRLHRERFSHMPFEVYSGKVRTERSEEAVNEWLDSMKSQARWRIVTGEEKEKPTETTAVEIPEPEAPAEETTEPIAEVATTEQPSDNDSDSSPSVSETPSSEETTDSSESPDLESSDTAPTAEDYDVSEPTPETPAPDAPEDYDDWITDRAEVERAIATKVIDKAFETTRRAEVSAEIPAKNLSPGLLARLKGTANHHRKHPAIVIPPICKILEAEHMAVFKRNGKLFTGPARPHPLAPDAVLAKRPAEMVKWIRENPPAKLEGLWKAVLPEGATAPPSEYAADLFWLLQQGHILLYTDDTLVVQEQSKPQEPRKPKQEKPKSKKKEKSNDPAPKSSDSPDTPAEIISDAAKDVADTAVQAAAKLIDVATEALPDPEPDPAGEADADPPTPEPTSSATEEKPAETPNPPEKPEN